MTEQAQQTKRPGARSIESSRLGKVEQVLSDSYDQWITTVPRGCSGDRLFRLFVSALKAKPSLLDADYDSIFAAFRDCVSCGLDVGGELAPAYLAAYGGRLKFQIGFRGYLELAHRAGQVKTFRIEVVRDGDLFQFTPSAADPILHTWSDSPDRDELAVSHVYAQLVKTCGGVEAEVWSLARIEKHKDTYVPNAGSKSSKWTTEWVQMAKKTVVLALLRSGRVYLSADVQVPGDGSQ